MEKENQKKWISMRKNRKIDESNFRINGVYRGEKKPYNGGLAISKEGVPASFDMASYKRGEILRADLFL
ncbi:MAG: hypothetical protein IKU62_03880 [Ruminiclostridium sp.]|nr:hypothetical protein [Ruminiclostridium sp.]